VHPGGGQKGNSFRELETEKRARIRQKLLKTLVHSLQETL
jgi:hypothetical protein